MSHLPVLPILLPMFAGALLLLLARLPMVHKRSLSLLVTLVQLPLALALLLAAEQGISVYALGNWAPPYGIVLVVGGRAGHQCLCPGELGATLWHCAGG